jgi:hypothetical protein
MKDTKSFGAAVIIAVTCWHLTIPWMRNGIDSFSFKKLGKDERACTH